MIASLGISDLKVVASLLLSRVHAATEGFNIVYGTQQAIDAASARIPCKALLLTQTLDSIQGCAVPLDHAPPGLLFTGCA